MLATLAQTVILTVALNGAQAPVDCGAAPEFAYQLPGVDTASAAELRDARAQVQAHSQAITEWLSCMDTRAAKVFTWMTEDQRARWDEDLATIHNARVELERGLNERIRAYNARISAQQDAGS
ncbi:MAG: hypothetical protein ACFB22_14320 [Rhodothalassiaceae bacterium]